MQKHIQTTHQINAPIDSLWELIRTGANWENWFPIIANSRVDDGNRYCTLQDGNVLEEQFLAHDGEKIFVYNILKQEAFPAENIRAVMRLEANSPSTTTLYWSVQFDVANEEIFSMMQENITGFYAVAAANLEKMAVPAEL